MYDEARDVVVFRTGSFRFGVPVGRVRKVIPACEISRLPASPAAVRGVVTLAGEITAVLDPIAAFYPGEATSLTAASKFLLVKTARRELALVTDQVDGVRQGDETIRRGDNVLPATLAMLKELVSDANGIIYIADPETLLSDVDEARLSAAIVEAADG